MRHFFVIPMKSVKAHEDINHAYSHKEERYLFFKPVKRQKCNATKQICQMTRRGPHLSFYFIKTYIMCKNVQKDGLFYTLIVDIVYEFYFTSRCLRIINL